MTTAKMTRGSTSATKNAGLSGDALMELECNIREADFQETAEALLAAHQDALTEDARMKLQGIITDKPRFGYWTKGDAEYDREYDVAMELARLKVFKGNVEGDRDQYDLACRLRRENPHLVGMNLTDYRRQFSVFLSPRAEAMRRFALAEIHRQRLALEKNSLAD
ncbi:MAG: hypothetical protein JRJ12_11870 [Deltaproteobacteria bacterium]|nr:hypothetical protein [Deltaproteobacteria bacterium]MBW2071212.1 hypothetical protein [Deltaproteobacteria bacterium]